MRTKFIFLPARDLPASHKALQEEVLKVLSADAVGRRSAEKRAVEGMKANLKSSADKHQVLFDYEKQHLNLQEDWEATREKLRFKGGKRTDIAVTEFFDKDNHRGTAQIEGTVKGQIAKLGTAFLGDARFVELRPQPKGLPNKVYALGRVEWSDSGAGLKQDPNHTDSHFVWLPQSETYCRRYVVRGLNHNDIINVAGGRPLGAPVQIINAQTRETTGSAPTRHNVAAGTALSETQQILSHTRGWQKRYISTGVSNRPVFSTRGTQFISLFGTAVIDLAMVDLATVFDIHSPMAVHDVLGWNATQVTSAGKPGSGAKDLAGETFLALRDVLRTRELLIKFLVPMAAVRCVPDGKRIVGLGGNYKDDPDKLLGDIKRWTAAWGRIEATDTTNYPGFNNKFWLFLLFRTAADADWFNRGFRARFPVQSILLTRYVMPATLPGWASTVGSGG
jgi:hypothetical protein